MQKRNELHKKGEGKCIWMSAGVINYRLCDHNYECEECEFDRVMRGLLPQKESQILSPIKNPENKPSERMEWLNQLANQYLMSLVTDCQIYLDRCYHPSHLWSRAINDDAVRIGIDKLIIKVLEPISQVVLPKEGQYYQTGQLIAWVVRRDHTFPFHAPISGRVTTLNSEISPDDWARLAQYDCWLFKMEAAGIQKNLQKKCSNIQSLQNYAIKIETIRNFLIDRLQTSVPNNVKMTLADGNNIEHELEKVLGSPKFKELTEKLFSKNA